MAERLMLEGGGWLEMREDGAQIRLSVCRGLDGAGLYKVWLHGNSEEYLLGTLIPEGRYLRLERTVSRESLIAAGCWPITGGKSAMVFSFTEQEPIASLPSWRWEHRPALRFDDPVLSEAAAAWGSMLLRESGKGFQLAIPFDSHRPFPLTPIFCFADIGQVDGQLHVVFSFDTNAVPQLSSEIQTHIPESYGHTDFVHQTRR